MSQHTTARDAEQDAAKTFERHRPVLVGVAYRMLGRHADAEDVVQEAWLRWAGADRDEVREPRAYLVRTTTRLAVDRLRHVQSRREAYPGEWLPEPRTTDVPPGARDGEAQALLTESVSLALLVVLETLSPLERAVFVLREAFGYPYAEIAQVLGRAEPAVRQLAGRARRHVEAREQRFDADAAATAATTERFLAACATGDLAGLLAMLAPDVRLVADGGGVQRAPRRVLYTPGHVGRFLLGSAADTLRALGARFREVNGAPAVVLSAGGRPHTVAQLATTDGLVTCVYLLSNPRKLSGIR